MLRSETIIFEWILAAKAHASAKVMVPLGAKSLLPTPSIKPKRYAVETPKPYHASDVTSVNVAGVPGCSQS